MTMIDYTPTPNKLVDLVYADGNEPLAAATTNVSLEQLADAVAYCQTHGFVASAIWLDETESPIGVWQFTSTSYAANTTAVNDWRVSVAGVVAGDVLIIDASFVMQTPISTSGYVKIGVAHGGGAEYQAPGLRAFLGSGSGTSGLSASMSCRVVASGSGTTVVRLLGKYSGPGGSVGLFGPGELRVSVFRPM
jgi:hypothetical protein